MSTAKARQHLRAAQEDARDTYLQYQMAAGAREELTRRSAARNHAWDQQAWQLDEPLSPNLKEAPGSPGLGYPEGTPSNRPLKSIGNAELCALLTSMELTRYITAFAQARA